MSFIRNILGVFLLIGVILVRPVLAEASSHVPWWQIQSVDTMKYSRDKAAAALEDLSFDTVIDEQVKQIADVGATHVAIATPYDERFIPVLTRWVKSARTHGLNVWFRGNFAGWEGWFDEEKISREQHKKLTKAFIDKHADLFEDGDLFSPCPECENGGPGDPRQTKDIIGHRQFLIDLYKISRDTFQKRGKNVHTNIHSMNGDVAELIMDEDTTRQLGGIVTIDHYVASPTRLAADIKRISTKSKGKVVLGEFGAPIPDIHGRMSEKEQADWIKQALKEIAPLPELIGVNYWVNVDGSTALWSHEGQPKQAVEVLASFYTPRVVRGTVRSQAGRLIQEADVASQYRKIRTRDDGSFELPLLSSDHTLTISKPGFYTTVVTIPAGTQTVSVRLASASPPWWQRLTDWFTALLAS